MSSNRLMYDNCAYVTNIKQSVAPTHYMLDVSKYENCNKCRMDLGIVGGVGVSHIRGNLVDLENELRGQNRNASACPTKHYVPARLTEDNSFFQPSSIKIENTPNRKGRTIDTRMQHLPSCQMIRYKSVPLPENIRYDTCPPPKYTGYVSCPRRD